MSGEQRPIAVVGWGTAATADPARYARNSSSFFADPAGWLVAAAVQDALDRCPEHVLSEPDQVGIAVLSDDGPAATMRTISDTARRGLVSPLRFAGANPGILAGLPCIRWKLRGPSLTFTMELDAAIDVARVIATAWLYGGQARYVLIVGHRVAADPHGGDDLAVARAAVTRPGVSGRSLREVLVRTDVPEPR